MPKFLIEYNTGDDNMDNWLSIIVCADSVDHAINVAKKETNDDGIEYVCTQQLD